MKTKFIILIAIAAGVLADGAEKQLRFGKVVDTPAADQTFLNSQRALERQQLAAEAIKQAKSAAAFRTVLSELVALGVDVSGIVTLEDFAAKSDVILTGLSTALDAADSSPDSKALPRAQRRILRALLYLKLLELTK